jgi:hypothetical protein
VACVAHQVIVEQFIALLAQAPAGLVMDTACIQ